MFSPSREQARDLFFDTWRKYRAGEPLSGMETLAIDVILQHPEYHRLLEQPERYRHRDYVPEAGETNPFLHLSLHLAIREQLSIDQPAGIRARHHELIDHLGDAHEADHVLLECLAEMIWQAQRTGTPPDAGVYFGCLDHHPAAEKKPG